MYGYTPDKDKYLARLRRIEGQVRGLQKMVEDDKYCIDILTQVSAVTSALQSVALGLLEDHLGHCVAQATAEGGDVAAATTSVASGASLVTVTADSPPATSATVTALTPARPAISSVTARTQCSQVMPVTWYVIDVIARSRSGCQG